MARTRKRHTAPPAGVPIVPVAKRGEVVFTIPDLVKRWKCNRHTIADAIADGRLAAFVVSKRGYRITATEVARFEQLHMQQKAAS